MRTTAEILERARALKLSAAPLSSVAKNRAVLLCAEELEKSADEILKANKADIEKATGKISEVMLDRLRLDEKRIFAMAEGMRAVAALPDPVGRVLEEITRPDGLSIRKVSVPMGVVAIIYESRPNVTSDAAALAFKSGNICVLRSGKEAYGSAYAIVAALRRGLKLSGLSEDYVSLVEDTARTSANELMTAAGFVDLLIPRGGKGLIRACVENATVPCIETGTGICHIYVDKSADTEKALKIIDNAKTSRPSVCNAAEVCLVHKSIATEFLPSLYKCFEGRVEILGDSRVCELIPAKPAGDEAFDTEFLDYKMAIGITDSIEEAVRHIALHSTHHSDCIITEETAAAEYFTANVDSAAVYVNASTRFTDGGEFGLGCEMGISTQKLHARGPMGLCELNTYKYIVSGNGHIR